MTTLILGASGEVGGATARRLAESDEDLILHSHSQHGNLAGLKDRTRALGTVHGDVSNPDEVQALFEEVDQFGQIDRMVFAVGINPTATSLVETTTEDWLRTIAVNLTGAFFCVRSAADRMRKLETSSSIVLVSSIFGLNSPANRGAYSASKHGMNGLVQSFAKEEAPRIRINAVCPGPMWTENVRSIFPEHAQSVGISVEEYIKERTSRVPAGRFLELEECASLVAYLLSDKSSMITGESFRISGGEV